MDLVPAPPRIEPLVVGGIVGATTFRRAQGYHRSGMVSSWRWDADELVLRGTVAGSGPRPYTCRIWFAVDGGRYVFEDSACTCPVGIDCKHVAATLLHVGAHGVAGPDAGPVDDGWRSRLWALTGPGAGDGPTPATGGVLPVALRFRLDGTFGDAPAELSVRPVVPARSGGWKVAPEASWDALTRGLYAFADVRATPAPQVRRWFADLGAVLAGSSGSREAWRPLAAGGRAVWPLLAEASELEIPLVGHGAQDDVRLAGAAAVRLEAAATTQGVRLRPVLTFDDDDVEATPVGTVGDTGFFAVAGRRGGTVLHLGPAPRRLREGVADLLAVGALEVPTADLDELYADHLPALRRVTPVVSDGSVTLPPTPRPVLVATVRYDTPEHAGLTWTWEYPRAGGEARRVPLDGASGDVARDPQAETEIRDKTVAAVRAVPGFAGFDLSREGWTGLDALDLAHGALPALAAASDVRLDAEDVPDYLHLDGEPRVVVDGAPSGGSDWLDLGISVTVDGRTIPFARLFTAMAQGRKRLLLVDGSWLRLDQPVLARLRELIDESASLSDRAGQVRVSRYDADLWHDLEDVADSVAVDERWRRTLAGLRAFADGQERPAPVPLPDGVRADLRDYQRQAFDWLTFLWRHDLGGILADDMGLGKTLEALTFLAHARTERPHDPPFLVVAPASVVANWVLEADRFTPHLRVVAMASTSKKLGTTVADVAASADVVVTSYAVHRLDADAFGAQRWSGLLLDEAQFAKNPRTRTNRVARAVDAPFKLALTGTPLENDLVELWGILAIVAPALYPSLARFREATVRPVAAAAADDDPAVVAAGNRALARLKRRIRPLMLRRTKEQVAPELPERTEQVLRVPLTADHRKVYDTHLQRERQRLLGLLDDFEANRVAIFRSLTTLRRLALDASLVDDAYARVGSAKLDLLAEQLPEIAAEGHRVLVFSQFTSFLRRVAARCDDAGLAYAYLDGSTTRRADVVAGFKAGTDPVFLISLKAGGFGLNLTEADYVYLLDPWWNPAAEAQAVDRTHRIGQTRPVVVTRLVAADTIEEKVMALARRKAALFDAVLDDEAGTFAGTLAVDDVRGLLEA
ncbi:SNF2-related protein [Isoptericola jiangsuensis]|uniref:DEAD/DEAH box helicase n=1 Tax=Isoptericola jiangsuensis TaxID=548579 RepID=UPI003AAED125